MSIAVRDVCLVLLGLGVLVGCSAIPTSTGPLAKTSVPANLDLPEKIAAIQKEPKPADEVAQEPARESSVQLASAIEYDTPFQSSWDKSASMDFETLPELKVDPLAPLPPWEKERVTYGSMLSEQWAGICSDYAEFYSASGMTMLAGGVAVAGVMANTGFDEKAIRDGYIDNVVLSPYDDVYETLHKPKILGNGKYTIPLFVGLALAEPLLQDLPLGPEASEWGWRSTRTLLVGAPPMLALQRLTGAGRPDETPESSEWHPLRDTNGVSGHAFMGAIPFISAAKMTDNLWLKGGLYVASTLPGISRVNDDAHYFSQVALGWFLAYLAETAVDHSYRPDLAYHFYAYPQPGGMGIGFEFAH